MMGSNMNLVHHPKAVSKNPMLEGKKKKKKKIHTQTTAQLRGKGKKKKRLDKLPYHL